MDEELILQMILEQLLGGQQPEQQPEPGGDDVAQFLSLLAQPDATRVAPDAGQREVPSFSDVARETGRVGAEAVTGLPSMLVELFQEFQRDPITFSSGGDVARGNVAAQEGTFGEAAFFSYS